MPRGIPSVIACIEESTIKTIKVLGSGCANCKTTIKLIEAIAQEKGTAVELEKVEDIRNIMGYGVMSTPAVVVGINARVMPRSSSVPNKCSGSCRRNASPSTVATGPRVI